MCKNDAKLQAVQHHANVFGEAMAHDGCTELVINDINNAFLEINGQWHAAHELATTSNIQPFIKTLASYAEAGVGRDQPLLSATLPCGERVQAVVSPVVTSFALSIRKPSTLNLDFDAYAKQGAFEFTRTLKPRQDEPKKDRAITTLLQEGAIREAIELMITMKKTIIISGGTSSGKTTFFNAVAKIIHPSERLITIEDTREIHLIQQNRLYLVAQRNSRRANFNTLLEACLRLRPDRILAAELRGPSEALAFLEGANTGHPGSISTLHSNSTSQSLDRLVMMLMRANIGLARDQITRYITDTVDAFIHFDRDTNGGRAIREIRYDGELFSKQVHQE